jgi:uncharacterized membrane protein YkoI
MGATVNLNKRKLATAGVLAAVLIGGGASVAAAAGSPTATPTATVTAADTAGANDPGYTGSVPAPADNRPDGQDTAGGDSQEAAALQSLATVTPSQAESAALAAVPGTVQKTQLENENGSVVYGVEVKDASGTVTDVKVDAGNGNVLDRQVGGDNEAANGSDQPEGPNDAKD